MPTGLAGVWRSSIDVGREPRSPSLGAEAQARRDDAARDRSISANAFGGLRAVDDVDFAVAAGSITGIIGPNGAGKTTFFNLISRALPATSGPDHVRWPGRDRPAGAPDRAARHGAHVPGDHAVCGCHGARKRPRRVPAAHHGGPVRRAWCAARGWRARSARRSRGARGAGRLPDSAGSAARREKPDAGTTEAARDRAWPSWRGRRCCCSTSRSPASTPIRRAG